MRLPRVRFTTQQMLVVVAVVSVFLGITAGLLRRSGSFRQQAEDYARKASQEYILGMIAAQVPWVADIRPSTMQVRMQEAHDELGDHYAGLAVKYKRAAARPWLPVGTDPSPPNWPSDVPYDVPWKGEGG
jgi:hypothetical protein